MSGRVGIAAAVLLTFLALPAIAHHSGTLEFEQHVGAQLPLELRFSGDAGRRVLLRDELGAKPTVLVLGYLSCHELCPLTLSGIGEALRASGLEAGRDYRALFVSIDPRDTPMLAARKSERIPAGERSAWTFLGGDAASVQALARSVGFSYRYDAAHDTYEHPAGFVVLDAHGAVSRYFFGVRFDARALGAALRGASTGEPGSTAARLILLCSHFDPLAGRYSSAILDFLRALAVLLLAGGVVWAWRRA